MVVSQVFDEKGLKQLSENILWFLKFTTILGGVHPYV